MHTSTKSSMSLTLKIFLPIFLMHSSIAFCASALKSSAAEKEKEAGAQQCGIALSFEDDTTKALVQRGAVNEIILLLRTPSCKFETLNYPFNKYVNKDDAIEFFLGRKKVLLLNADKKTGFDQFVISSQESFSKDASVEDLKANTLYTLHLYTQENRIVKIKHYSTAPLDCSSLSLSNEKTAAQAAKASTAIAKNSATTPIASSSSSGAVAVKSTSTQTHPHQYGRYIIGPDTLGFGWFVS